MNQDKRKILNETLTASQVYDRIGQAAMGHFDRLRNSLQGSNTHLTGNTQTYQRVLEDSVAFDTLKKLIDSIEYDVHLAQKELQNG